MAREQSGDLWTAGIDRGKPVSVFVDGREVQAFEGDTVLAVLWASGNHAVHTTARVREPRGYFCGIGMCFDCLVTIDDIVNIRACLEPVRRGMKIKRQQDAGYTRAR